MGKNVDNKEGNETTAFGAVERFFVHPYKEKRILCGVSEKMLGEAVQISENLLIKTKFYIKFSGK